MVTDKRVHMAPAPELPLHELLALEAVSRLGSVQAAADALHVTSSGISHRIGNLESKVGTRLLQRKGRGVVLTALALDYVDALRRGLVDLSQATEALRESEHQVVRIATAAAVGVAWLLPLLKEYTAQHKQMRFEILTVATANELPPDRWDLLVHYGALAKRGSQRKLLFTYRLIAVCAPWFLTARSKVLGKRQLAELPSLRLAQLESSARSPARRAERFHDRSQLIFDDALTMLESAAGGAGIAISTETAARPYLASKRLVMASSEFLPGDTYFVDLSEGGQLKPSASAFFQWIVQQARLEDPSQA